MRAGEDQTIRRARPQDAEALSPLLEALGYPTDTSELRARLERLLASSEGEVVVAEENARLVGLATFQIFELIYRSRPQCRLTALVVGPDNRRRGVGRALLHEVERTARERGCFRIELTTRATRSEALSFYTALGYAERRRRLAKQLSED